MFSSFSQCGTVNVVVVKENLQFLFPRLRLKQQKLISKSRNATEVKVCTIVPPVKLREILF